MKQRGTEIRNVEITSTFLGVEDHGIFTCYVQTMSDGVGQGFGGHSLKFKDYGIAYLQGILNAVGVESWEELVGKNARVDTSHERMFGIGHIIKDNWFYPEDLCRDAK